MKYADNKKASDKVIQKRNLYGQRPNGAKKEKTQELFLLP